ncbi:MAG: N-acetylmuramoyl-L-alanine amidase [Gemmatimonadaceae bacterium]
MRSAERRSRIAWLVGALCILSPSLRAQTAPVICVDPGHPSEVSAGDVVQHGTTEVHVAWLVAQLLVRELESRGVATCITKHAERELVRNRERAEVANRARAVLQVRLHCDAGSGHGFAVYYPDRAATKEGRTGPSADIRARSRRAATAVDSAMRASLSDVLFDGGIRGDSKTLVGSKQGALTGSIFSDVPVVTVEMVVLTDARDAAFAASPAGQQRLATAIADGAVAFARAKH